MQLQQYNVIISFIRNYQGLTHKCMKELENGFPEVNHDTLHSILSQEYQRRMKLNHRKTQSSRRKYWESYKAAVSNRERPGVILRIAEESDVAPCLIAKIILQFYFEETEGKVNPVNNVNIYLRDTTLIPDMDLAYEAFLCTLYDNQYSPLTETMKSSIGQQYEIKLYKEAERLGLAFRDEDHLRKNGYDKTPDCKLDVPVAIDGFVINWIESKALFGDAEVHKEYTENQYLSYWNRFGPGLVIYWFGFLDSITEQYDKRFIIRDSFPTNITFFPSPNFDW